MADEHNIFPVQKSDYLEIMEVWESSVRATHLFLSEADFQYFKPLIMNQYLDALKVDVNEQNPQAVGFYEHMGFEVISRSPLDSLGKPFPLLHMQYL